MFNLYILCKVDVLLPDSPSAKSHVETMAFVVDQTRYEKFVHYIDSEYDFYSIVNCGDLYSRSSKYVHKDFTRL